MSESDKTTGGDGRDLQADRPGNGLDFEILAASLRATSSDMALWMAVLGSKMAGALPDRVQVHRSGFWSNGAVNRIDVDLGAWRLALHLEHGYPVGERTHVVRGIALKTEQLSLDVWITSLSQALTELAATSAREEAAILSLLR